MYEKLDVIDGAQLRFAGKRIKWPEAETIGWEAISLIWITPSAIDVCKARCNGWAATSIGRKTEPMAGNRNPRPGGDFAYLETQSVVDVCKAGFNRWVGTSLGRYWA